MILFHYSTANWLCHSNHGQLGPVSDAIPLCFDYIAPFLFGSPPAPFLQIDRPPKAQKTRVASLATKATIVVAYVAAGVGCVSAAPLDAAYVSAAVRGSGFGLSASARWRVQSSHPPISKNNILAVPPPERQHYTISAPSVSNLVLRAPSLRRDCASMPTQLLA